MSDNTPEKKIAERLWREGIKNPSSDLVKPPDRTIHIGRYERDDNRPVRLPPDLRQYHMQLLGQPGKGKSRFLEKMIREDILANHGLILLDPSGNLYNDLVKWLIEKRLFYEERFILINPNNVHHALAYNIFYWEEDSSEPEYRRRERITDVVDKMMGAFTSMMGDEKSEDMPLYSRIARLIFYVLAEQHLTLNEAIHLIRYKNPLQEVLSQKSTNPIVHSAWEDLTKLKERDFMAWFMAPINRIEKLLILPTMQCMFGQENNALDFESIANQGKVVLVNLNPTTEGYTNDDAVLLGRIFLNDMANTMRKRVRQNNQNPRSFYCYIDECDLFLTESIVAGVEKLRQFGLKMILSHQSLSQLDHVGERVRGAVGNAQLKMYFGISAEDADVVCRAVARGQLDHERSMESLIKPTVVAYNEKEYIDISDGDSMGGGQAVGVTVSEGSGTGNSSGVSTPELGLLEQGVSIHSTGSTFSDFKGVSESIINSSFWSQTHSETRRTSLVPELQWLPTQVFSMEAQLFDLSSQLQMQSSQYAMYGLPGGVFYRVKIANVDSSYVDDNWLVENQDKFCQKRTDLYSRKADILNQIEQRQKSLIEANILESDALNDNASMKAKPQASIKDQPWVGGLIDDELNDS